MLKKVLAALLFIVVLLLILIAIQPGSFEVRRSLTINAQPSEVFALVNDFHRWDSWSPWAKLDPAMKVSYSGPPSGSGASYSWVGNDKVGEGRMTIVDSQLPSLVRLRLEFLKPFPSTSQTEFAFTPDGSGTQTTWIMRGENNFMAKGFMMFMGGMDKVVGPDFERGLAQLKAVAEARK